MATLSGDGTLYDEDENELAPVRYRIEHEAPPGEPIVSWAGEVSFDTVPDVSLEPGRYLLILEDGSRGEIEIEPTGAASAGEGQIAFSGTSVL
ncbi:MAG: hypothetical protein M3464_02560 [Chloroflexota bacterium]|nr:hypothetical protein [Chloroflexota bacterium]